jgi:hypothetical protein
MMPRIFTVLLDFVISPGLTWLIALLGGFDWLGRPVGEVGRSLLGGVVMMVMVSAYAYQTGYKGFYPVGRKLYFYVVFIAPIVVGAAGLLVGWVMAG